MSGLKQDRTADKRKSTSYDIYRALKMDEKSLCEVCRSTIFSDLSAKRSGTADQPHHNNVSSIRRARHQGCFICFAIKKSRDKTISKTRFSWDQKETGEYTLSILCPDQRLGYGWLTHSSFNVLECFNVDKLETLKQLADESRRATNSESSSVAKLAKFWLKECVEQHKACHSNLRPDWYPRRLLDLAGGDQVRLRDTALCRPHKPYATLSHCWGDKPFMILTKENICEFRMGIHRTRFPKTFQDVMAMADRLQLQYIWIDCYCIIQSENNFQNDDKMREIGQMDRVYANAILNFGATHATSPFDGCFVDRNTVQARQIFVTWQPTSTSDKASYTVGAPQRIEHKTLYSKNPIFQRAWVLQERLLCSRMLHLGRDEVWWECSGFRLPISESAPRSEAFFDKYVAYPFSVDTTETDIPELIASAHRSTWSRILHMYTRMSLSHPTEDKLVAIGGIAKRMESILKDEYIAGLFRVNFLEELLWEPLPNANVCRAEQWRALSWSWAGLDCPVSLAHISTSRDCVYLASVMDIEVKMVDPGNKYGRVESASLNLKGLLMQLGRVTPNYHARLNDRYLSVGMCQSFGFSLNLDELDHHRPRNSYFSLFAMPIFHDKREWRGLILERLKGPSNSLYRRVGIFDGHPTEQDLSCILTQVEPQCATII